MICGRTTSYVEDASVKCDIENAATPPTTSPTEIKSRAPRRLKSQAEIGIETINASVRGIRSRPDCIAERPSMFCKKSGSMNSEPNSETPRTAPMKVPAEYERYFRIDRST